MPRPSPGNQTISIATETPMTETNPKSKPITYQPESQRERWLKYGLNVALVSVVVIVLAGLIIYLAQDRKYSARLDTTRAGLYSLKPQTLNIIKNNQEPIRIVSLYTR